MPEHVGTVLLLILLLELKHMFADFYLQTEKMLCGRCEYFHMGRAQHAAVHSVGSIIVLAIIGCPSWILIALAILEWVIHFHIDFWKGYHSHCKQLQPNQCQYWRAVGFDQFLHHATYVGMVAIWASVVF